MQELHKEVCCATCKKRLKLSKFDYSNGGCEHTELEGYVCMAFAHEGEAIWMIGANENSEMCECHQPKTNADRIRSMTDEELASFLCHVTSNEEVNCDFCIATDYCSFGHNGFIDWLRKEVEES